MRQYPVIDLAATGERIRELRILNHLKVEDVSEFMGFESVQAVYKWQRGESLPTVDNLFALSRLFETSMENILIERGGASPLLPFIETLLSVIKKILFILNQQFISFFSNIWHNTIRQKIFLARAVR